MRSRKGARIAYGGQMIGQPLSCFRGACRAALRFQAATEGLGRPRLQCPRWRSLR